GEHEPVRPIDNPREHFGIVSLGAVVSLRLALHGDGLAEHNRLLAFPHVAAEFLPARIRGHRARLDAAAETLRPREQLVADAVGVELLVGSREDAGIGDRGLKQISKRCNGWSHGPSCWRAGGGRLHWQEPSAKLWLVAG